MASHLENTDKKVLGNTFDHWTPVKRVNATGNAKYLCECSCGVSKVVEARTLLNGTSKSCGHVRREYSFPEKGKEMSELLKKHLIDNTNTLVLNQKVSKNSTTEVKGVHPTKNGKYRAYISFKGKRTYLGFFDTLEEAKVAREKAEEEMYKPFLDKHKDEDK